MSRNKPKYQGGGNASKYSIVNNKIEIRSADRSAKDVGGFRDAQKSAESVHYPNRCRLYDYYDDISSDPHLSGIISKRVDAILNKVLTFQDKAGGKVDAMDDLIGSTNFRNMMREAFMAKMWGMSLLEFVPGAKFEYYSIPRKHIKPHLGIVAYEQNGETGDIYDGMWNFWFIGDAADLGLYLKCTPYALYKRGNIGDWAQFVEIYGIPMRIVYYDANDIQTSNKIDEALDESGGALTIKLPRTAELDVKDGKQVNGDGSLQNTLRMAMNDEMSVAVLGNTETTTSSKSSGYAQSKEHGKQQLEVTKSDIIDMLNILNDPWFFNILKSYGYPVEGGKFVFAKEYDYEAIKNQMVVVSMVKKGGTPVEDDYVYELTGIPKPKDYDAIKKKQEEEKAVKLKQQEAFNEPENISRFQKIINTFNSFFE
ncbi:MAG: DUF935 family protein [Flavipsychrobacter sp.]